jgi:hypothetical protein
LLTGDRQRDAEALTSLHGRRSECAALDGLLAGVRGGRSAVLVLRGEAGIGKTALLGYLTERAAGFSVARCMGVESQMELAFTGLHDLCAPMLSYLDALVEPQREALCVALGLASGVLFRRLSLALTRFLRPSNVCLQYWTLASRHTD